MTWIISKALQDLYASWLSSQGAGVASSGATSSGGKQSQPSNGNPTPLLYLHSDKMTESLPRFQSLITSSPLTESHGKGLLTWYLEVFLAKTSAAPVRVQDSAVRVQDFGVRWRGLSTRYDHDSHLWKTRPSLWDEGLTSSLPTLPRWGLMRDGVLWERVTLTRLTSVTASGSLPTPVKYDTGGRGEGDNYHGLGWQARYVGDVTGPAGQYPKGYKPSTAPEPWPTPLVSDQSVGKDLFTLQKVENGHAFNQLAREVRKRQHLENGSFFSNPTAVGVNPLRARSKLWPTPVKNEDRAAAYTKETSFKHFSEGSHQVHLAQAVRDPRMFPTPTASDTSSRNPPAKLKRTKAGVLVSDTGTFRQLSLGTAVKGEASGEAPSKQALEGIWPTPMTTGMRGGSGVPKDLDDRLNAAQGPAEYGELNPDWVEWIMNWPISWTSLAAMDSGDYLDWFNSSHAQPDTGRNVWWQSDPSDYPELGIPKTVKPATKTDNDLRMHRIAGLGNGQVSSVVAAAWTFLLTLIPPTKE